MSVAPDDACSNATPPLYHRLSGQVAELIAKGSLRPGERVPSVRRMSAQYQVSISTVIQAYSLLESRGLIEARPQSGYYVRPRAWTPPPEPEVSLKEPSASEVHIGELIMRVVRETEHPGLTRLGANCANMAFHAPAALHRAMSVVARRSAQNGVELDRLAGAAPFRTQVARRAVAGGCALSPSEIVATSGATESVSLALRAVTKPGDLVAVESPTFWGFLQLFESLGLRAIEIPTYPRDGVCLDALAYALEHQKIRACLFVLNFGNPLGACMADDKKEQLVRLLSEHEVPLIEDDVYGSLHFGPARPRTAKSFDREGLVLLCDSFNKSMAPGYRVGWIAPGRFQAKVEYLKLITTDASAWMAQMAFAEFLATSNSEYHMRRIRRFSAEQMARVQEAVARYFPSGTKLSRPGGGQLLWVEMPPSVDSLELYRRALQHWVAIMPGPMFSAKQKYQNCIRLNTGNPWSPEIEGGLRLLGQLCAELAR